MASHQRNDPYRNFRFRVEIDGGASAGFSDVEIGASEVEVVEYREGGRPNPITLKLPGVHKTGDVTLKRGMTTSWELFQWYQAVVNGDSGYRRNVAIILLGEDGTEQTRFLIREAWPRKFLVGKLNAKGNEVLIESLELVNEGIDLAQ